MNKQSSRLMRAHIPDVIRYHCDIS